MPIGNQRLIVVDTENHTFAYVQEGKYFMRFFEFTKSKNIPYNIHDFLRGECTDYAGRTIVQYPTVKTVGLLEKLLG